MMYVRKLWEAPREKEEKVKCRVGTVDLHRAPHEGGGGDPLLGVPELVPPLTGSIPALSSCEDAILL